MHHTTPTKYRPPVMLDDRVRDAKNARAVAITRARQASPNYCQRCSRRHAGGPCAEQQPYPIEILDHGDDAYGSPERCPVCGGEFDSIEDPGNPGHYAPGYEPYCISCGHRDGDPVTFSFVVLPKPQTARRAGGPCNGQRPWWINHVS